MKTSLVTLLVFGMSTLVWSESSHALWLISGSSWYERWLQMERQSARMSDEEKIENFKGILGAPVGEDSKFNEEEIALYYRIRDMLMRTPGHAKYFSDKIKEDGFDSNRRKWFKYLEYLPTPETVKMLGDYLTDESGKPSESDLMKMTAEQMVWSTPNCDHAAVCLLKILDDPPVGKTYIDHRDLKILRVWFEDVKSGSKTFRFKGQNVKYRFRPDGTWDTIPIANPPDDGPESASETKNERPARRPVSAEADARNTPRGTSWWWYGIGGAGLVAACAWLMRKKRPG